jgi:hypothetical protein
MVTMLALLFALSPQPCLLPDRTLVEPSVVAALGPPPPPPPKAATAPPRATLPVPLAQEERAQYRISFGILGQLGALNLNLTPGEKGDLVQLLGQVKASVFGIGESEKRVVSEVDTRSLEARRWTTLKLTSGKSVTDFARQPRPGTVALVRRRPGKPDQADTLVRRAGVMDPLAFILRLRLASAAAAQTYEVLDGHGLWLLRMAPGTHVTADLGRAIRLEGKAEPVFWDGSHDDDRPNRSFTVWLSDDAYRIPLRLVMPLAVGEVRADLLTVSRSHPRAMNAAAGARSPGSLAGQLDPPKHPQ